MYQSFYAGMAWKALPTFALLLFVTVFALMIVRNWFFKRAHDFDETAALPLADDVSQHSSEVKP